MHPAAKRAFWIGLFVIWFDFTWNNIPFLPNLVGYALLAWALARFAASSHSFGWARACAVGLAGVEAIRLLSGDLADPPFITAFDPWHQIAARLPAIPLLLSAALYWFISGGLIDCLRRVGEGRLADRLGLVRAASLAASLLNVGAVLWRSDAPGITINITSLDWMSGGLALIPLLLMLLIVVGEIVLWAVALRRLPDTLEPVAERPAIDPRLVRRIAWGLVALVPLGVGASLLLRAPKPPVLLKLAGGRANSNTGGRAAWSPDGTRLAVGGTNMPARVYDPVSGAVIFETSDRGRYDVHDLAWSPDGRQLLSAGFRTFIDDGFTGQQIACIPACADDEQDTGHWADGAAWSPDGHTLALLFYAVRLFDTQTMTYTHFFNTRTMTDSDAVRIAYSPDGTLLATAGQSGQARIWTPEGELVREFAHADGNLVGDVAWSPDGNLLAVAADYNLVTVWDVRSRKRIRAFLLSTELDRRLLLRPYHQPRDWSSAVAWSPDGRFLAAGSTDATAAVWELASGDQVLRLSGQTGRIGDIEFSPDGRRIATASEDETVWIWDSSSIYE